jgi:hypothetical protein
MGRRLGAGAYEEIEVKRTTLLAAAAVAISIVAPANAAEVILNPVGDGTSTAFFGGTITAPGGFTSIFTFQTLTAGFASASVDKTSLSNINFTSATLNGQDFSFASLGSAQFGGSGPVSVGVGTQTITVNGTGTGSFGGSVAFQADAVAAVPEPATWAMMLFGFGAVGYSIRRRKVGYAGLRTQAV